MAASKDSVKKTTKTKTVKLKKAAKPKKTAKSKNSVVTPEERLKMIAEAAYYRAERVGFDGSDAHRNWLESEEEIDEMLNI